MDDKSVCAVLLNTFQSMENTVKDFAKSRRTDANNAQMCSIAIKI
jgi:hypothetical protein